MAAPVLSHDLCVLSGGSSFFVGLPCAPFEIFALIAPCRNALRPG